MEEASALGGVGGGGGGGGEGGLLLLLLLLLQWGRFGGRGSGGLLLRMDYDGGEFFGILGGVRVRTLLISADRQV